jgi:hypothetical protein
MAPTLTKMTVMEITGLPFSDYSVRGVTMVLNPERSDSGLQRAGSGKLLDLTAPQLQKYQGQISCDDTEAPNFNGVWQGTPLTIKSVAGVGVSDATDGTITRDYLVDNWSVSRDEWGCIANWSLTVREA